MESLVIQAKKKITLDKFDTSVKLSLSSDIKQVLNVSSRSVIASVEQSGNIISISGKVFVNVLYLNQQNQVQSGETSVDFIQKQQVQIGLSDMFAVDESSVKIDTFSGSEILCSVTHNTQIYGIYRYEISDFVGENTSFVVNKKSVESNKFVLSAGDNFVVAEEQESNVLNMQILQASAKVLSYAVQVSVDKIVIDGKFLVETIYKDLDGTGLVSKVIEFKQEIEANGALPSMISDAIVSVRNVTVTSEEKQEKTNMVYTLDVVAKGYVYERDSYDIAADMFSLDSEIKNTYDYLEFKNYSSTRESSDMIISVTDVSQVENFDDIIGVYEPKVQIGQVNDVENKTYVEATISAYALYKSGEEIKRHDFSYPVKFECEKEISESLENVCVEAEISSFKVKAGKDLEVAYKTYAMFNFSTLSSESYVKSFEIKEEKVKNNYGIKVYVTKSGESLFDVAKVLSVRPEIIEEQNEVDGVFEQGEKVYVYSPANLA